MEPKVYARKYLRITPDIPLYGMASIVQVGVRRVYTGTTRVRILDISPGGLKFVSTLRLPVDSKVILDISLKLDEMSYFLQGCVVHSSNTEVCEYEYGFRFLEPDSNLRESLKKLYTRMSVRLNRHIVILKLL